MAEPAQTCRTLHMGTLPTSDSPWGPLLGRPSRVPGAQGHLGSELGLQSSGLHNLFSTHKRRPGLLGLETVENRGCLPGFRTKHSPPQAPPPPPLSSPQEGHFSLPIPQGSVLAHHRGSEDSALGKASACWWLGSLMEAAGPWGVQGPSGP